MGHICTNESLVSGGFDLEKSECPICCKTSTQKAGYVGVYCPECKRIFTGEEWAGDIARQRREILRLTKKEIGERIGKSKHTIHGYEWKKCPRWYLDELRKIILEG
jgi:uncharacterized Zn finger protein (UPF0148 family)